MKYLHAGLLLAVLIFAASLFANSETGPHITHASWYGPRFFGRIMKCGRRYTPDAVFTAHRTYPIGTKLKVTNLRNQRSIVVSVEDRGPFVQTQPGEERDLDLSYAAAQQLDMISEGVALVSYSEISPPS